MASLLDSLNSEWSATADSPTARRALMRWSATHSVFLSASNLNDVITLGHRPDMGPEVRRALAALAPVDPLAARTLLQALLGGLVNLARRVGRDGDALDEIVSLAWERIRTYPTHRPGGVAGNVLWDVRKRYSRQHDDRDSSVAIQANRASVEPSPEEQVVGNAFLVELETACVAAGVSSELLDTIVRTRVDGESMADLAVEHGVSRKVLWHRRWRAEARLRDLPLAG
jgi:hypothetical protein